MNPAPFIPQRTRAELSSPAPPGQRHEQMAKVVLPLLGAGLEPQAVFVQCAACMGQMLMTAKFAT